ncbi:hypothetical protein B1748_26690 [Paenibacillus sp. MY03]|uniref:HD-GYP domain-containing protein n=1 Tax=Paenibacillus TaxID=44249 RepID=UPI000B3CB702|nr:MULTISPECIES: HD domain-containing phosphohydrolase [Paenibacillus]OUS71324.1 hypothetical protein B1748_26690 [Paenibacillus sp. MY03]
MRVIALSEKGHGGGYPLYDAMEALRRKHPDTYYHCIRTSLLAEKFAAGLELDKRESRELVQSCLMHDIGKLLIDNSILDHERKYFGSRPGALERHPAIGVRLLEPVMNSRILAAVRHQNERWDGGGTPDGLTGEHIPQYARICAILDIFDGWVMPGGHYSHRTIAGGVKELRRLAGNRLDPGLVELFIKMVRKPGALYMYGWPNAMAPNDS